MTAALTWLVGLVIVLVAAYGFASRGPTSFRAQWRGLAARAIADSGSTPGPVVTEHDLAALPAPLAAYVRRSGAVGRPRVTNFCAHFHGRIRGGAGQDWMPFTGKQVSTFGHRPRRVFLMEATRAGLPVTVLHSFAGATATMRVRLLSVLPLVNASGAEMDRGETVTVFNDLVVLAPGALVDAPVRWTAIDGDHVRGDFTDGDQTVSAELTFDADHDLVDFTSHDRWRASADGRSFTRQAWSTPLTEHGSVDGRRTMVSGLGRWHAPEPEGSFTYVELHLDAIAYDVGRVEDVSAGDSPVSLLPVSTTARWMSAVARSMARVKAVLT